MSPSDVLISDPNGLTTSHYIDTGQQKGNSFCSGNHRKVKVNAVNRSAQTTYICKNNTSKSLFFLVLLTWKGHSSHSAQSNFLFSDFKNLTVIHWAYAHLNSELYNITYNTVASKFPLYFIYPGRSGCFSHILEGQQQLIRSDISGNERQQTKG